MNEFLSEGPSGGRPSTPSLNHSGHFAYNTFLYAFFNGVIIYGIPSKLSEADGELYCPIDFIGPDVFHSRTIFGYDQVSGDEIHPYSVFSHR